MAHFGWSQTSVNLVTSTYHTLLLLLPITYSSSFVVCFPSVQFIFVLCCLVIEQSVKQMWSSHLSAFLGPFFMVGYVEHNENHNMWKCMYWFLLHDRSWAEWNCKLTIFIAPESAITSDPCLNRCVIQDLTWFEPTIAWENQLLVCNRPENASRITIRAKGINLNTIIMGSFCEIYIVSSFLTW